MNKILNLFIIIFFVNGCSFHKNSKFWSNSEDVNKEVNKIYTEVFLKKWGVKLTKIFLTRKDFLDILNENEIGDLFKKGKFGDLIRKIT